MKTNELRKKSEDELKEELLDLLKEQFNLRMKKGMGEVPRRHLYKRVRRSIARVKTLLKECMRYE